MFRKSNIDGYTTDFEIEYKKSIIRPGDSVHIKHSTSTFIANRYNEKTKMIELFGIYDKKFHHFNINCLIAQNDI